MFALTIFVLNLYDQGKFKTKMAIQTINFRLKHIYSKNISFKVSRYKTELSQNKNLTRISLLHELIWELLESIFYVSFYLGQN